MSSAAVRRGAASWWRSVAVHLHTCAPRTSAPSRARVVVGAIGRIARGKPALFSLRTPRRHYFVLA